VTHSQQCKNPFAQYDFNSATVAPTSAPQSPMMKIHKNAFSVNWWCNFGMLFFEKMSNPRVMVVEPVII
jgi:hypothetical protein